MPSERAWRHPSELGPHGAFQAAAPLRRRAGTRFVAALTLGTAGSLVIALLASVHAFGPTGEVSAASNAIEGSIVGGSPSFGFAPTTTQLIAVLTSVATSTTVAASMPAVVKVHTADPNHTIHAALVDDGSLVTTIEELGDAKEGEAVLADGSTVKVTVYRIDAVTGMAHLRAAAAVDGAAEPDAAWMGVSCGDGREATPTADGPAEPTPPTTAVEGPSTTTGDPTTAATAAAAVAGATSSSTAAPTTVARNGAPPLVGSSAAPTTAAPTTVAPAAVRSTVGGPVATGADATTTTVPVTALGLSTTTETALATTTTAAAAMVAGVRVLAIFPNSPAAGTLQEGDLIIGLDGHAVHTTWALVLAVRQHPAGTTVTVEFLRDGRRYERPVLLAPAPTR